MTSELATQISTSVVRTASVVPERTVGKESNNNNNAVQNKGSAQNNNAVERNQTVSEQASNTVNNTQSNTQSQQSSASEVDAAVDNLNEFMKSIGRDLSFTIDEDLEKVVITVVDTNTDEVIRKIPTEEALAIAKSIEENMSLLFSEEA